MKKNIYLFLKVISLKIVKIKIKIKEKKIDIQMHLKINCGMSFNFDDKKKLIIYFIIYYYSLIYNSFKSFNVIFNNYLNSSIFL